MKILFICCFFYSVAIISAINDEKVHLRAKRSLYDKNGNKTPEHRWFGRAYGALDRVDKKGRWASFNSVAKRVKREGKRIIGVYPKRLTSKGKKASHDYFAALDKIGNELRDAKDKIPEKHFTKIVKKLEGVLKIRDNDLQDGLKKHENAMTNKIRKNEKQKYNNHVPVYNKYAEMVEKIKNIPPNSIPRYKIMTEPPPAAP